MLSSGGPDGNERLTTITGVILLVLLAIIGVTILRIHQLISVHLFVGVLLIGPVGLKLASTGYRFVRYYAGNPDYRRKGPPELALRLIGPIVVLTTVVVLASGVVLMVKGADHRDPWLLIHKASFIVWIVFTSIHVVGHLPRVITLLRPGAKRPMIEDISPPGRSGRAIALASAVVLCTVLAVALIPDFSSWTGHLGSFHHDG
jgi:hypothetical protein